MASVNKANSRSNFISNSYTCVSKDDCIEGCWWMLGLSGVTEFEYWNCINDCMFRSH